MKNKKILIPMYLLAFICCAGIFISALIIFHYELNNIWLFVICGVFIVITVILGSIFLAGIISKNANIRLSEMVEEVNKANESINKENKRLMLMLDTSPTCIQIWDKNLNTIDCNEAAVKLYKFNNKQEYIDNFVEMCSPEFQPNGRRSDELAVELVNKAFSEGYLVFEWMHQLPADGTPIPAEITLVRSEFNNDDIVLGYTVDLREHKKMMRAVEAAHFTTSAMFKSNPHINILFNNDFKIIDCNPAALEFFGFTDKQELFDGFFSHIQENSPVMQYSKFDTITTFREQLESVVEYGIGNFEVVIILNGDLKSLNVELIKIPYIDDFAIVAYIFDMTELIGLQEKLLRETATLQAIFDAIPDMVFCKDIYLNYTRCNKSLLEFFNLKEEDIIGKDDINGLGVPPELAEEFRRADRIVIDENRIYRRDEEIRAPNGSVILVETSKAPLTYNGEVIGLLGVARDITYRKAMEEAAQNANMSKTQFLANMSHEIRTPMNSIIGFSELAKEGDVSEETRNYLGNIQNSAEWLLRIINDILDISKIESGKLEFENIPFDLQEIFESCKTSITPRFNDKKITLTFHADHTPGKMLLGDPVRLRQVIMNLLSNAVKFTESGTVNITATNTKTSEDEATVLFQVKDTGIGMTPDQIDKIFQPYMQADDSITRRFGGTGLGLTITRNIIKLMGGTLMIESKQGVGSCFTFELTFCLTDESEAQHTETAINENERPVFNGEVLICEDNLLNQQVICEHLSRVGLQVISVNNGKKGVDLVSKRLKRNEKQFDLIFMDIHMPIMDGLDAASRITALGVKTPIVALTANVMISDLELYKISGMYDTLSKPFKSIDLWKCLTKYLPVVRYDSINKEHQAKEDAETLKLLSTNFVKSNQAISDNIVSAVNNNDLKKAHRLLHSLKSNAGQIGETRLQQITADAERKLLDGQNLLDDDVFIKFNNELKAVLDRLAPLLQKEKSAEIPETTDIDTILDTFDKLEPLLKNNDTKCMTFIKKLKTIRGTNELIEQMEEYKYKQALILLNNIRKNYVL